MASSGYEAPAAPAADSAPSLESVKKLEKDLSNKKLFCCTCGKLAKACEKADGAPEGVAVALADIGKRAFTVLQSRFTNPKYWEAGLEFFLALEFHVPAAAEKAVQWRETAMAEVDEEARERAEEEKKKRRYEWEKKYHQGRFGDDHMPIDPAVVLASQGIILLDSSDTRPGMSRDAVHELRLVTIQIEDTCPVCQEVMPVGSKAKCMPCGHKFHDECLISWVSKNNSCPMCRYDELPSEKVTFDDVERRIQREDPGRKGIFT